ncbi:MAG: anthranilate phosphoribosyltransferase [Dehalococcoidia bacterium]|nr:anthranilate phosphoribosyltransferase [Dehalococcoidia bacterium]
MIRDAIGALATGRSLDATETACVMREIMQGDATPAQIGAFVMGLRMKGETADEIAGMARAMLSCAVRIDPGADLDTCGTGGDGSRSFNISTAAAFVASGAGVRVAKHGNRAMSSQCGSADVLEALGVRLDLEPDEVKQCITEMGIGFLFAPRFHPAMKYAAGPRREIGVRTVFNILGPLCNPAGARTQLLGVAEPALVEKMAGVLHRLGFQRAMVVHGEDGLDEISPSGKTIICELNYGRMKTYSVVPGDFGLKPTEREELAGGTARDNAALLRDVLVGRRRGPCRDVVVMNAAAGLMVAGAARTLREGAEMAFHSIDSGRALKKLDSLAEFSCRCGVVA